jgi:cytochrome c biogenesis protein CcdA/thiol-disulfide isomerase/thioredoxin
MAILLGFAFISGIITILSPCILPVLPIVLSGGVGGGKRRPFGVVAGFVVSFTVFTLALSAIVQALGIPVDAMRWVAVVLVIAFGVVMLVPRLRDWFEIAAARVANLGRRTPAPPQADGTRARTGFWSGIPVGLSLGLIWTPCVGPIMASVISLALSQRVDGGSVFITLAYTLGTSIPMLAVMLGGRALLNRVPALTKNAVNIQKGFGVLMILVGVAIGMGWDRQFQTAVLRALPNYGSGLTAIENAAPVKNAIKSRNSAETAMAASMTAVSAGTVPERMFTGAPDTEPRNAVLGDYGLAPDFLTKGMWFNTAGIVPGASATAGGTAPALTMADLRGKVVVVDFWTYSCVNCVRTIPYLKAWYDAYKDKGLVIVGVHTPEFEFEKNPANVARAIKELGVDWPVVQDNNYVQWNAYSNMYWPAHYFIDARGRVRYFHFGEGEYATSERVIQELLAETGVKVQGIVSKPGPDIQTETPETYLGYERATGFTSAVKVVPDKAVRYSPAGTPTNGQWSLAGEWTVSRDYVTADSAGVLRLGFHAKNVFLVIQPTGMGGNIEVRVDGKAPADTPDVKNGVLAAKESRMYQLVGLSASGPHVLSLNVGGGLRLFAFTFG